MAAFDFPAPPLSASSIPCPYGQHSDGRGGCVPNVVNPSGPPTSPTSPSVPNPADHQNPYTPAPTPTPGGGGGAQQPGDCAALGKVWRADTKRCEFEDERHNAGQDTCGGDLPNCPPGQDVWCDFTDAQFKCARSSWSDAELCGRQNRIRRDQGKPEKSCAELGFGGGGASGGGGARATGTMPGFASNDFDALLRGEYEKLLRGPSRYTPEVMQGLFGQITSAASGAIRRGSRAVMQDAASRNMQRAGSTGAALRDVRNKAEVNRGAATLGVMTTKINADHQDKLDALDRAQRYLDSLRDNEYRYALMGEQRRQFDSNLALAYANLAQQRTMLNMQLQSAWDMLKANQAFQLLLAGT